MGTVQCCGPSEGKYEIVAKAPKRDSTQLPMQIALEVARESDCVAENCEQSCKEAGAVYAIFWGYDSGLEALRPMCHWSSPEHVAACKVKTGGDELYTTESCKVQMKPGEGFVGKVYANNDAVFFPDVSKLPLSDFKRRDLAARHGIISVALKPFGRGVMEVGTTKKWDACHWIHTVTPADCERAAREAGASFGIYWTFDEARGVLRAECHWDAPEHVAEMKAKTGGDDLYSTGSYATELTPGVGVMGRVFLEQKGLFLADLAAMPGASYKRKGLAARFGVVSLAVKPFKNGLMEVGSTEPWSTCTWHSTMTAEDCKCAAKEAGADFAIFWGFDASKGVLRPVCHWDPPEHVAKWKEQTGNDELYTTESYKVPLRPGVGFVGKAYLDGGALFFADVSTLNTHEFQRRDLAKRFGIVSLALKPFGSGVMEIGATKRWDSCEWVSVVSVRDCERAAKEASGSSAIYWGFDEGRGILRPMCHWDPPERIAEARTKTGLDDLYTTESYRFPLKPGVGFVGKAYENQETMFFKEVSELPLGEYRRKELAARFGVNALAYKPFANGVMEVASSSRFELRQWVNTVTVDDCQRVCREAGASYAIYWLYDQAEEALTPSCHWSPPERVAFLKATTGQGDIYTSESYKLSLMPNVGIVGQAFADKSSMFFPDVSKLHIAEYKRKDLAARCGIQSVALKPYGSGVYEVGSTTRWSACAWANIVTVDDCRRACLDTNGSYAIFWAFDKARGVFYPAAHWNPPDRVAAVKAETGGEELYTTESYKVEMKPGVGYVGKVFQFKEEIIIANVSKVSSSDFVRKDLAKRFGIKSIALLPLAQGVMEVGGTEAEALDPRALLPA